MNALEEEARQEESEKQKAKEAKAKNKQADVSPPPSVEPSDKAQRNFTDPDSRIMKVSSTSSFEQCYNGQTVVDDSSQIIVAANLSQNANNVDEVEPILDILEENLGGIPHKTAITTDAGYFSENQCNAF